MLQRLPYIDIHVADNIIKADIAGRSPCPGGCGRTCRGLGGDSAPNPRGVGSLDLDRCGLVPTSRGARPGHRRPCSGLRGAPGQREGRLAALLLGLAPVERRCLRRARRRRAQAGPRRRARGGGPEPPRRRAPSRAGRCASRRRGGSLGGHPASRPSRRLAFGHGRAANRGTMGGPPVEAGPTPRPATVVGHDDRAPLDRPPAVRSRQPRRQAPPPW